MENQNSRIKNFEQGIRKEDLLYIFLEAPLIDNL